MIFKETCKPRISDFGRTGKVSLTSILCLLEDTASHQCTYVNDDVLMSLKKGSVWVCTNWKIRIVKMPAGGSEFVVSTWAKEKDTRSTVLREYRICDMEGNDLILAEAKFVRMDIFTGKPIRITDELYNLYEPEEEGAFQDEMIKLIPPESFDAEASVMLRASDIDFNGHVHNTRYLDIAAAGIPDGGIDIRKAREINIAYRNPLKEKDSVIVRYAALDNGCFLSLDNSQGPCCLIRVEL